MGISRTVKVTTPKFKPDLYFSVISILHQFYNIQLRQTEVRERKHLAIFQFVKGHNSRMADVAPLKFKFYLCFVIISIFV